MKGRLARIAQGVLLLAPRQRLEADDPVHRRAHFADRIQFLVNDGRVSIQRLEQEAIQSTKIARDIFLLLDLLDAIDRSGLTCIKGAGDVLSA